MYLTIILENGLYALIHFSSFCSHLWRIFSQDIVEIIYTYSAPSPPPPQRIKNLVPLISGLHCFIFPHVYCLVFPLAAFKVSIYPLIPFASLSLSATAVTILQQSEDWQLSFLP